MYAYKHIMLAVKINIRQVAIVKCKIKLRVEELLYDVRIFF